MVSLGVPIISCIRVSACVYTRILRAVRVKTKGRGRKDKRNRNARRSRITRYILRFETVEIS